MHSRWPILAVLLLAVALVGGAVFLLGGNGADPAPKRAATSDTVSSKVEDVAEPPTPEGAPERAGARVELEGEAPAPLARATTVAATDATAALRGVVVDSTGRPVVGAEVRLLKETGIGTRVFRLGPGEDEAAATTKTKGDGAFAFDAVPTAHSLRLAVRGEDLAEERVLLDPLGRGERRELGEVRVFRAGSISGVVVDESGSPVAKARVSPEIDLDEMIRRGPRAFAPGEETGEDGRWSLRGLRPGTYAVTASSEGGSESPSVEVELAEGESAEGVRLRLPDGLTIAGTVFDRAGQARADARVEAWPESPGAARGSFSIRRFGEGVRTGADGRYVLAGLDPSQTYRVVANDEGHLEAARSGVRPGSVGVDLTLGTPGRIVGKALVAADGTPLRDFRARAAREDRGRRMFDAFAGDLFGGGEEETVRGSEDGSFAIEGLDPGAYRVEVRAEGFAPASVGSVLVRAGDVTDAGSILLSTGSALIVEVRALGDGEPLAGAKVSVRASAQEQGLGGVERRILGDAIRFGGAAAEPGAKSEQTDESGIATFAGLAAGTHVVRATLEGRAPAEREVIVPPTGEAQVTLDLGLGGNIQGTVRRADGGAMPGATVFAMQVGEKGAFPQEEQTDADGRYRFESLRPGDWRVSLEAGDRMFGGGSGGSRMVFRIRSTPEADGDDGVLVHLAEGETAEVDLQEKEKGIVAGRVTDRGAPVSGIGVRLHEASGPLFPLLAAQQTETDSQGGFRFEGVSAGSWKVVVSREEMLVPAEEEVVLVAGEVFVTIEIPQGGIEGRVTEAGSGRPLAGARVALRREAEGEAGRPTSMVRASAVTFQTSGGNRSQTSVTLGGEPEVRTDAEGRYRIENVPEGNFRLQVSLEGYGDGARSPLRLAGGDKLTGIDVALDQGGKLAGTVLDAARVPVPFAMVEATATGGAPKRTVSGMDGKYEIDGLAGGDVELRVRVPGSAGGWGTPVPATVRPGRTTDLDLRVD